MLVYSGAGWDACSEMECGRRNHGALGMQDVVYVVGGEAKGSELNPCPFSESWDPVKDTWSRFPNPNNNRTKFSATNTPDRVCVFGGFNLNPDEFCNDYTWESYDPRIGKWESPQALPGKYTDFTVAYLENELFMIGGSLLLYGDDNWTRDVHVYDLRSCKWRRGPDLPVRSQPELCEIDQLLGEFGGIEEPNIPIPTGAAVLS